MGPVGEKCLYTWPSMDTPLLRGNLKNGLIGKHTRNKWVLDKIHYQKIDAHQLKCSDNTIDAIFLLGSLHHIPDKIRGLKEILRILKKEGKIILFDYTDVRIEQIKQHSHHHPPAINPKELLDNLPVSYTESLDEKKEIFCYIIKKN